MNYVRQRQRQHSRGEAHPANHRQRSFSLRNSRNMQLPSERGKTNRFANCLLAREQANVPFTYSSSVIPSQYANAGQTGAIRAEPKTLGVDNVGRTEVMPNALDTGWAGCCACKLILNRCSSAVGSERIIHITQRIKVGERVSVQNIRTRNVGPTETQQHRHTHRQTPVWNHSANASYACLNTDLENLRPDNGGGADKSSTPGVVSCIQRSTSE